MPVNGNYGMQLEGMEEEPLNNDKACIVDIKMEYTAGWPGISFLHKCQVADYIVSRVNGLNMG